MHRQQVISTLLNLTDNEKTIFKALKLGGVFERWEIVDTTELSSSQVYKTVYNLANKGIIYHSINSINQSIYFIEYDIRELFDKDAEIGFIMSNL